MDPLLLPSNQPPARFYAGGKRISSFRGEPSCGPNTPEDWVASTTTLRGEPALGLTYLADGVSLAEYIQRDPQGWLGAAHLDHFGVDTKLLVKLLDAGQRLPVHAHPDTQFALKHLGAAHGKAEAWYILTPGTVHLGLRRDVTADELSELVKSQDSERMLALMHTVEVGEHDTVYVPTGLLHAVGEGILLAEVQEPEDLSILLEWRGFDIDGATHGHLGLGFDTALAAVERRGNSSAEIEHLIVRGAMDGETLVHPATEYFRLEMLTVDGERRWDTGFAVVILLDGELELVPSNGARLALASGSTAVIPFAAGTITVLGTATALIARPPRTW